jgi:hypothetical protein
MPVTIAASSDHSDHRWIKGPARPIQMVGKWLATILQGLPTLDKDAIEIFRAHEPANENHAPAKASRMARQARSAKLWGEGVACRQSGSATISPTHCHLVVMDIAISCV